MGTCPVGLCVVWVPRGAALAVGSLLHQSSPLREPTLAGARRGGCHTDTHLDNPCDKTKSDVDKYPPWGPQWMADVYFSLRLS